MSALQSYARQIGDDTLLNFAKRIKGRAVQQMGKILKEIPASKGGQPTHDGNGSSRTVAAKDAGLSERQQITAIRVASIPPEQFAQQIESENVPSITALAEQGTKKKPYSLEGVDAADHILGTRLIGLIGHVLRESKRLDIAQGSRGIKPSEINQCLLDIQEAVTILHRIYLALAEREKECIPANS